MSLLKNSFLRNKGRKKDYFSKKKKSEQKKKFLKIETRCKLKFFIRIVISILL